MTGYPPNILLFLNPNHHPLHLISNMSTTAIAATTYLTLFIIGLLTPAHGSKSEHVVPSNPPAIHAVSDAPAK